MSKKKDLMKLSDVSLDNFIDKIKERYIERYADDVIKLLEDKKKLEKALERINKWLEAIQSGNIEIVEEYKKSRKKLEDNDDAELE